MEYRVQRLCDMLDAALATVNLVVTILALQEAIAKGPCLTCNSSLLKINFKLQFASTQVQPCCTRPRPGAQSVCLQRLMFLDLFSSSTPTGK